MPSSDFNSFPILTSERLLLRQLALSDEQAVFALRSDEAVNRYIGRMLQQNIIEARNFIKMINNGIIDDGWLYWAVCMREHDTFVGTICLWNFSEDRSSAELGYELSPAHQGKGLMDEAVKIVLQYGFQQLRLRVIEAFTHEDNVRSKRLLEKNGFVIAPNRQSQELPQQVAFTLNSPC